MTAPNIAKLARVAALSAKRRYPWCDLEDMVQEAAVAMLAALPKHREGGAALEPFLLYSAWFRLRGWIWEDGVVRQRPDRNNGFALRAPVEDIEPNMVHPEALLQQAQLDRAVQQVLERASLITAMVLTGEAKPSTLARDLGVNPKQAVYEATVARAELRAIAREHLEEP